MIKIPSPALPAAWQKLAGLLVLLVSGVLPACAQTNVWTQWGKVTIPNPLFGTQGDRLASDGTNLYYSTLFDGVYQAPLATKTFSPMPMTGFPLWNQANNTNGYAVWNLAVAPHGTLLISGNPESLVNHSLGAASGYNTLPVFYWWNASNQQWQAAAVTGKSYPYTSSAGNFSMAPDGSVWACSGFYPYAYRSTDDGHSYTAFDINASVPSSYFPIPPSTNQMTFGKVFSIVAGPKSEVVIGTETGGFLHSTNNGLNWTSLDPDFTNSQTLNPLSHIGNAQVVGLDHYGNFLCASPGFFDGFAGSTNWDGVTLIGYHPGDGTLFNASTGFQPYFGPGLIVTPDSGVSFTFLPQNYQLQGGIYRSPNGRNWTQFNNNIPALAGPLSTNLGNSVIPGNCITTVGNLIFIATGNRVGIFDSTPLPVTNRPPAGLPQNFNLAKNTAAGLTLAGTDVDGNPLNFTLTSLPSHGTLTGSAPHLTYLPASNFTGLDNLFFAVDDGMATSAPVLVNFAISTTNSSPPTITLTSPASQTWLLAPANIFFSANVVDPNGTPQVSFYNGTTLLKTIVNPPYTYVWTNVSPGDYTLEACVISPSGAKVWAAPMRLSVLQAVPQLQIQKMDGTNVAVDWPQVLDNNFFVETATNPTGPWTLCPNPPQFPATGQTVTVPMNGPQFFRLMHPH